MCKYFCSLTFARVLLFLDEPRKRNLGPRPTSFRFCSFSVCFQVAYLIDDSFSGVFCLFFGQRLNLCAFSLSPMHIIGKPRASFFEFMCSVKVCLHSGYSPRPFPILLYLGLLKIKGLDRPRMFLILEGFTV